MGHPPAQVTQAGAASPLGWFLWHPGPWHPLQGTVWDLAWGSPWAPPLGGEYSRERLAG